MYTHPAIVKCLRNLIGFAPPYEAAYTVDADLSNTSSGMYVNFQHPLLTYENLYSIAEQFERVSVKAYQSGAYPEGAIVKVGSQIFQAIQAVTNQNTDDTAYWRPTNLLSAYLRRTYDASALKLINTIFTEKKLNEVAKSLLGSVSLYEGVGNISGRITKNSRMVGLKINLKNQDTVAILNNIGLQIDTVQNPMKIYLFHSSQPDPVSTFNLNVTKSIAFQWYKVAGVLNRTDGAYYLVYFEDELTGSAVKKQVGWDGRQTCGTCTEAVMNSQLYNKWSRYISIQPFYVQGWSAHSLWDETSEVYIADTNWGMNIQMSVQCDVSDTICANASILTNALAQQLTVDFLTQMTFSPRDNQVKEKVAKMAAFALDNQENGQYGEAKKLTKAIQAVSFDFSGLSEVCLPCQNQNGFTLTNAWRG